MPQVEEQGLRYRWTRQLKQYRLVWWIRITFINFRMFLRQIPMRLVLLRRSRWERQLLHDMRLAYRDDYLIPESNPLITVTIATYNRAVLLERTLKSVLNQTYQNFEIIVVGDGCIDDTAERIAQLNDERIRFINFQQRSEYPAHYLLRWMVAGTHPINRALEEAQAKWIFHIDDDDIYQPYHMETLLRHAQQHQHELVHSKMARQINADTWAHIGRDESFGQILRRFDDLPYFGVGHSSVMFRRYLRVFKFDSSAWRTRTPGDQHVWIRMKWAGVKVGFVNEVTVESPLRPSATQEGFRAEDRNNE